MKRRHLQFLAMALGLAMVLVVAACSDAESSETTEVSGDTQAGYVTVDVNQAYERLSVMNTDAVIVDVREPDEWAATGVPVGAVLIPLGELEARALDELNPEDPVYVICNSGNRSRTGSQTLVDLGFEEVYNVDGGMQAWLAAALPVEYPEQQYPAP